MPSHVPAALNLLISEISEGLPGNDKAASCQGAPWIELYNDGSAGDLYGHAVTTPTETIPLTGAVGAYAYTVVCQPAGAVPLGHGFTGTFSVEFGGDFGGQIIATATIAQTTLPGNGGIGKNWARDSTGAYQYTISATPGGENSIAHAAVVITEVGWLTGGSCASQTSGSAAAPQSAACLCNGRDWVELTNEGSVDTYLSGWTLRSSRDPEEDLVFPKDAPIMIRAGEIELFCQGAILDVGVESFG